MNKKIKFYLKVGLFLLVLGIAIYANSFGNQLFWDDNDNIVNNVYIKSWKFFPNYFTENLIAGAGFQSNHWRPLLLFSWSLDYKIWGLNPFGFHLTNTLLHIINSFLVFFIILFLFKNKKIAILTAVFFLVHPVQTETVTYVSGRGDILSVFFLLLSLIFYHFFRKKAKREYLISSCFLFIFALLSKETAIFFPALLVLYEIVYKYPGKPKNDLKSALLRMFPVFAIALLYLILRLTIFNFGILQFYPQENIYTQNINFRIFTFLKVLLIYYSLIFAPLNLHMERSAEIMTSFFCPAVLFSAFIIILMMFLGYIFYKKGNELFLFGFGLFFIGLIPVSNVFIPINAVLTEHWLYFPIIGILLVLSFAINFLIFDLLPSLYKKNQGKIKNFYLVFRWALCSAIILYLAGLSYRTIIRNQDWKDPITFYSQTLKYSETARVHNNLAMALDNKKDFNKAIAHYKRAIELADVYPQTHNNLGNSYKNIGETGKAIEEFNRAIEMDRYFLVAYNNLVILYLEQKEYQKAIDVLEKILEVQPDNQNIINLILKIKKESQL